MQLQQINEIVDFLITDGYFTEDQREELTEAIKKHTVYQTIMVVRHDDNSILAVIRWNVEGDTLHILDCLVKKQHRGRKLLKRMLLHKLKTMPELKFLKFERLDKKKRRYMPSKICSDGFKEDEHVPQDNGNEGRAVGLFERV